MHLCKEVTESLWGKAGSLETPEMQMIHLRFAVLLKLRQEMLNLDKVKGSLSVYGLEPKPVVSTWADLRLWNWAASLMSFL